MSVCDDLFKLNPQLYIKHDSRVKLGKVCTKFNLSLNKVVSYLIDEISEKDIQTNIRRKLYG